MSLGDVCETWTNSYKWVEIIVSRLADVNQTLAKIKREFKTKTSWAAVGEEETGNYCSVKAMDSPQVRETLIKREKPIAYFLADILGAT